MTVKEKNERYKQGVRRRVFSIMCLSAVLLLVILLLSLNAGYSKLPLSDVLRTLIGKGTEKNELTIFTFRLPRILLCAVIGAGLALSGCIVQGITRNPLADFGLLGISSGGGLMVVLYAMALGTITGNAAFTLPFLSFIGAAAAAISVYALSYKKRDGITPTRLVLTGVAVQAGINALMTVLVIKLDEAQYEFVASWQAGTVWATSWKFLLAIVPWMVVLFPYVCYKARTLDILTLGDEISGGLGVKVESEKRKLLVAAVALAASCVAVGGNISFVGLIAPHLTKKLVGAKHETVLPVCLLVGAILVSLADMIGRTIIEPSSIPTGVMTAIIGAPYFIYLLMKVK